MLKLNWQDVYYQPLTDVLGGIRIEKMLESFDFGAPVGVVSVKALQEAGEQLFRLTNGKCQAQMSLYAFMVTRRSQALNGYFPLVSTLDETGQKSFYKLAQEIMVDSRFDLRIFNYFPTTVASEDMRVNIADQLPGVVYFVAAQIAEVFFYRRDMLERLLAAKPRFWIYVTQEAFAKNGGVAGGSFNGEKACIQLVLSRLFEGFNNPTPGGAPFLHEFGHMLDFLDVGHDVIGKSSGFLPGMRESDGAIYKPEARELFLKGKRLELERYMRLYDGAPPDDPLPIGHPYVFQNDTEFIAGYLEMFFRNPHYFAQQNPDLFQALALTFGWDTRKAWTKDYPYYVEQNRGFYLSGKKPGKPGLTLPE